MNAVAVAGLHRSRSRNTLDLLTLSFTRHDPKVPPFSTSISSRSATAGQIRGVTPEQSRRDGLPYATCATAHTGVGGNDGADKTW